MLSRQRLEIGWQTWWLCPSVLVNNKAPHSHTDVYTVVVILDNSNTSIYEYYLCFTTTSHHVAVVGAVLFHSFCVNWSEDIVIRTCNILYARVTEMLL